ncbi:MAG TPA: hypothetical protein VKN18_02475 [Blastocatellia bacterium]|nr:hypothetical protein [Blastocatellia bacterium]
MDKPKTSLISILLLLFLCANGFSNQTTKKPTASVSGTYKYVLNSIEVLEMPDHKVRIRFTGVWPNDRKKVETRNIGAFDEIVKLEGKTATVKIQFGDEPCLVKLAFQPNKVMVEQNGSLTGCGFGFNVEPDGTYIKVSSKPPDMPPREEN